MNYITKSNLSQLSAWCLYCYGAKTWNKICLARQKNAQSGGEGDDDDDKAGDEWTAAMVTPAVSDSGHEPLTGVISALKPSTCAALLEHQIEWAEALGGVASRDMAAWVYALLARAEKPLHPDHVSAIRTLAMLCGRQRAALLADFDGKGSPPPFVTALSLLICIVANYFSQSDLADA